MRPIYIMLTKTNSVFCKLIGAYTKEAYAHVSILLLNDFRYGYSFSRRKVRNPFIGGFMKEDYIKWTDAFPETECQMYELYIPAQKYEDLHRDLEAYYAEKEKYKYNFIAVVGQLFGIKIERKNRYFCSQFAAYILDKHGILKFDKEYICMTAGDFAKHKDLKLIYEGILRPLVDHPEQLVQIESAQ